MTQYGFYFDSTRCTGCRTCEMACKDYNDLPANYAFRRVFDYEGGDWKDKNSPARARSCAGSASRWGSKPWQNTTKSRAASP